MLLNVPKEWRITKQKSGISGQVGDRVAGSALKEVKEFTPEIADLERNKPKFSEHNGGQTCGCSLPSIN